MATVHKLPDAKQVKDEAARWVVRLSAGDVSAQDKAQFEAWVNAHPLHAHTFQEISETWGDFITAGPIVRAVSFANSMEAGTQEQRPRKLWLAAACLCLIAVMAGALFFLKPATDRGFGTAIGEQSTVSLRDGSSMELNSGSLARVTYTERARVIHLDRGEAFFQVAHDPKRPFWVVSGHSWVRAVGTAFNVYARPTGVQVTVSEGAVKVGVGQSALADAPTDQAFSNTLAAVISAGQQADIGGSTTMTRRLSAADIARFTAWRSGSLYFERSSLSEVVGELNRYTDLQLIIQDDKLRDLSVGGSFQANAKGVESLLEVLDRGFGLHIRREEGRVYIGEQMN